MTRPHRDAYFCAMAALAAARGTCAKQAVGCVLVDGRGVVLATGYNGPPSGATHCVERRCPGVSLPAGSDTCVAVHAEQNAVARCHDHSAVRVAYCTHAPCHHCSKLLMATGCRRVAFVRGEVSPVWPSSGRAHDRVPLSDVMEAVSVALGRLTG